jgi:hypothetical protein
MPTALLLEGADPALGAAVCLRLAQERGIVADAQPGQRAREVGRAVLRTPVVPQLQAAGHIGIQAAAPAVDDRIVNRLQGSEPVPTLATCAQASAV